MNRENSNQTNFTECGFHKNKVFKAINQTSVTNLHYQTTVLNLHIYYCHLLGVFSVQYDNYYKFIRSCRYKSSSMLTFSLVESSMRTGAGTARTFYVWLDIHHCRHDFYNMIITTYWTIYTGNSVWIYNNYHIARWILLTNDNNIYVS
jgi:hypothetical protein